MPVIILQSKVLLLNSKYRLQDAILNTMTTIRIRQDDAGF